VFDLDSTQLAALARSQGLLVSVAESPKAVPTPERPFRLAQKVRAGAQLCFVNHSGEPQDIAEFVQKATELGATVPYIVGVAVVTSLGSARQIQGFRNLVLPKDYLGRILNARNPRLEGIRAAVELGQQYLAIPGVRGLNLSAAPAPGQELELAADLAEVGKAMVGG
jgi:5,10-methylenetetrahydrofolate reductase